jgi:hypothetical protein
MASENYVYRLMSRLVSHFVPPVAKSGFDCSLHKELLLIRHNKIYFGKRTTDKVISLQAQCGSEGG